MRHGRHHRRHMRRWLRETRRRGLWPHVLTWRLHRRVFWWIAGAILVTAVVTGLSVHLVSRSVGATSWQRQMQGAQRFAASRIADAWDDPGRRTALFHELAADMDARAQLLDAGDRLLAARGEACTHASVDVEITRGAVRLGHLRACEASGPGWRVFFPIFAAVLVLWAAAGKIARRMVRPLYVVLDVAEQLGSGNLKKRAPLGRHAEERTLARALNRMADRIERQMANQRELLAQVSHELRTPLGHLRLLLELAREKQEPTTLDEIEKEIAELDALVGELLASSRVAFETLELRDLDAGGLASRALERAGVPHEKAQVDGLPRVHADATLLVRALANLLENAREHGGGVAALVVKSEGAQVRFAVRDQGPGFAPEDLPRAFDPFFHRARGADGDGGSLGLGLALVQRIARAHGGEARARNLEGGGAEVSFTVSAAKDGQSTTHSVSGS